MLYHYIKGYLVIKMKGTQTEQLLNRAAREKIIFRNLHFKDKSLVGYVSVKDFYRLRNVKRGIDVHITILEKRGLPFFSKGYRKRSGFMAGAVLFFAILFYMSGFVWIIEVEGNETLSDEKILSSCRQVGLYEGRPLKKIDTSNDPQRLLLADKELAWAAFNTEGCRVTVNVAEFRKTGDNEEKKPSNLKATADGVVEGMHITSGNTVVKIGDTVKKGDLLVSGVFERGDSTLFVQSKGSVTARTKRTFSASLPLKRTEYIPTGKVKNRYVLNFFHIKFPLYVGSVKQPANVSVNKKQVSLFGTDLPIGTVCGKFELVSAHTELCSKERITGLLKEDIDKQISKLKLENTEVEYEDTEIEGENASIVATVTATENIALEDLIIFNSSN